MALSEHLRNKLKRTHTASSSIDMKYKGNDVTIRTDADGNAIVLFIGKRKTDGSIAGERYVRVLRHDATGKVIKDHWDKKGKV